MAHLTSCPALHAARVLLEKYTFAVRPNWKAQNPKMEADERCIAIVIDYGTNIFHVVQLRPELRYWQQRMLSGNATAPDIAKFLNRLVSELEKLPAHDPSEEEDALPLEIAPMRDSTGSPIPGMVAAPKHVISRAAMEGARLLYQAYEIAAKNPDPAVDERLRVALVIDVTTEVHRCATMLPKIRRRQQQLLSGNLTADQVARVLRAIGLELEHLPSYEQPDEQVMLLSA